jgi:5-methyltetrahydrofolate--homocysteine methyltransferase
MILKRGNMMLENLITAMIELREPEALELAKESVETVKDPLDILKACSTAMEEVGRRFEIGQYFLPQLMMAGEILRQVSEMIKPKLKDGFEKLRTGRVLIGTVEGDIHDLGKDIVTFMLEVNGFEVLDLGIDVPRDQFVDSIKDFNPQVVGLSGFLTLAFEAMKETVAAIEDANLRQDVKIMIGGGQVDEEIRRHTGADAYGLTALDAVSLCEKWIGGK